MTSKVWLVVGAVVFTIGFAISCIPSYGTGIRFIGIPIGGLGGLAAGVGIVLRTER